MLFLAIMGSIRVMYCYNLKETERKSSLCMASLSSRSSRLIMVLVELESEALGLLNEICTIGKHRAVDKNKIRNFSTLE